MNYLNKIKENFGNTKKSKKEQPEIIEEKVLKSAEYSYYYARDILEGRFELGEKAISKNTQYSSLYAKNILKLV